MSGLLWLAVFLAAICAVTGLLWFGSKKPETANQGYVAVGVSIGIVFGVILSAVDHDWKNTSPWDADEARRRDEYIRLQKDLERQREADGYGPRWRNF